MKKIGYLLIIISLLIGIANFFFKSETIPAIATNQVMDSANCWTGPGPYQIPTDSLGKQIQYGRNLIANTAYYLGPAGIVAHQTNGMNCQNCHLEAGTKPWGNNYGAVASLYPKYRDRSGKIESIEMRVNDCLQRSLNGQPLDSLSKEMLAIKAYFLWLGKNIPKGTKPKGTGIQDLAFLSRAANPIEGKILYTNACLKCHLANGQGQAAIDGIGYMYPPLWGEHSYNNAAGLFRISRLAGFIKNNMPNPVNYHHPILSNEAAWDIAAYINSQPRPSKNQDADWPNKAKKPIDYPYGPYADSFSEMQHKYGPYDAIVKARKK